MSLLYPKLCRLSSVHSVGQRPDRDDTQGFWTQAPTSHPLLHFALAKACLHSPLNNPGPQAALHWLFCLAEAMLPLEPSQAHPLLQVLFLPHCLTEQTPHWTLLPTSHLHMPDCPLPHAASLLLLSLLIKNYSLYCFHAFIVHGSLLHCKILQRHESAWFVHKKHLPHVQYSVNIWEMERNNECVE